MVNRPVCVILVSFSIMILISAFVAYMGWLLPDDPHDRDYFVWGDKYVNDFDKSRLAQSELVISGADEVVPLQSQANNDWTVMLVYSVEGSGEKDSTANLWTQDSLISIREFEKDVKREDDYQKTCLAEQISEKTSTTREEVRCLPESFTSVLNIFPDLSKLETYS